MRVLDNTSVAIKKGNREGTTEFAQSFRPDFAACIFEDENSMRYIKKIKKIPDSKFRFILNTNTLKCFI